MSKGSGSLKSMAVAGTVLGKRNVPGREDEKTDNTVAPGIPTERSVTSALTTGV